MLLSFTAPLQQLDLYSKYVRANKVAVEEINRHFREIQPELAELSHAYHSSRNLVHFVSTKSDLKLFEKLDRNIQHNCFSPTLFSSTIKV